MLGSQSGVASFGHFWGAALDAELRNRVLSQQRKGQYCCANVVQVRPDRSGPDFSIHDAAQAHRVSDVAGAPIVSDVARASPGTEEI